jgi:hypothetical protein
MEPTTESCGLDTPCGYISLEFLRHDDRPMLMLGLSERHAPTNVEYTFVFANDAFLRHPELNSPSLYNTYVKNHGNCAQIGNWIARSLFFSEGPSGGVVVVTAARIGADTVKSQPCKPAHPSTADIVGVWEKVSHRPKQVDEDVGKLEATQPDQEHESNDLEILENDVRRPYRSPPNEFELSDEEYSARDDSTEREGRQITRSASREQVSREEQQRTPIIDWRIRLDYDDSSHFQNLHRVDW